MSVVSALERIERWAHQNDPAFVALLHPGLTRQEIEDKVSGLPFALAEEVYEMYQWRNGQGWGEFKLGIHQSRLYPFMPLQAALYEYSHFQAENFRLEVELENCDFPDSGGWFPLFGVDRDKTATLGQAKIELTSPLVYVPREVKTSIHYPSLTAMLQFRADLYESGAMRENEDGWQWADYSIASVIQRQHFPEQVAAAEANYSQLGRLDSPLNRGYYNLESQRSSMVCHLVSSGSELALPIVTEYLQEQISDPVLATSVLRDLLTHPNKVSKEWPWTRNTHMGSLAAHFEID